VRHPGAGALSALRGLKHFLRSNQGCSGARHRVVSDGSTLASRRGADGVGAVPRSVSTRNHPRSRPGWQNHVTATELALLMSSSAIARRARCRAAARRPRSAQLSLRAPPPPSHRPGRQTTWLRPRSRAPTAWAAVAEGHGTAHSYAPSRPRSHLGPPPPGAAAPRALPKPSAANARRGAPPTAAEAHGSRLSSASAPLRRPRRHQTTLASVAPRAAEAAVRHRTPVPGARGRGRAAATLERPAPLWRRCGLRWRRRGKAPKVYLLTSGAGEG
jgi:hypothetical protein